MHRIDTQGHKQNRFSDGNPTDTTGETGTVIDAAWLNAVQEEICGVIEAFGGKLSKGQEYERQMASHLKKVFQDRKEEIITLLRQDIVTSEAKIEVRLIAECKKLAAQYEEYKLETFRAIDKLGDKIESAERRLTALEKVETPIPWPPRPPRE